MQQKRHHFEHYFMRVGWEKVHTCKITQAGNVV